MTNRDDHLSDGFLVDGVAPSVIGGADSPGSDIDDDIEDFRPQREPQRAEFRPGTRTEPPTTPIPAQIGQARAYRAPDEPRPEQRKGWLGRMFGARE
jgi:hypothetical protein